MVMTDLLKAEEIKKALDAFAGPSLSTHTLAYPHADLLAPRRPVALSSVAETFDPKTFFEMVGMRAMSAENVKKVFRVLDVDGSGFIEEEELK